MSKPVTLMKGTLGLNNAVESSRLHYDQETGLCELGKAYNTDIEVTGRISRRKGFTATVRTESVYNLWSNGTDCLFMVGSSLYRLNADYSRTGLRSGMTANQKISFCSIGDKIYYSNGFENGYVKGDASYAWTGEKYVGPSNFKVFSDPPAGSIVAYYNASIYVVVGNTVYWSEPFGYSWFDLSRCFVQFESRVRMFRAVKDGIYAGIDKEVFFLSGKIPSEFERSIVSASAVVEGTDIDVVGSSLGAKYNSKNAVVWTAQDGIYGGFDGGVVVNLTKNRLVLPASQIGCAVFDKTTNRVVTLIQ
jgi:hypothetical protein